jgi:hypothetical protein
MEKAPILITVFDRPKHFRSCIESLAKNQEAKDTILYISSDGPTDAESAVRVAEVREYVKSIVGFKKIISLLPPVNTNSEVKIKAYDELRTNHCRYILAEDDNFFSPTALKFFNNALDIYEKNEKIIAVSGYMYPRFPAKGYEQVFLQIVACYGVALWRDKDIGPPHFDEIGLAKEVLGDKNLFKQISRVLPHSSLMIQAIAEGRLTAGDVTRSIIAIKQNKYSVYPSVSLVRNMGFDGSGEHCGVNNIYATQKICDEEIIFNLAKPIEVSSFDVKWLNTFFGGKFAQIYGQLVFFKFNANNLISRIFFTGLLKTYEKVYGKANVLVNRTRQFWHR